MHSSINHPTNYRLSPLNLSMVNQSGCVSEIDDRINHHTNYLLEVTNFLMLVTANKSNGVPEIDKAVSWCRNEKFILDKINLLAYKNYEFLSLVTKLATQSTHCNVYDTLEIIKYDILGKKLTQAYKKFYDQDLKYLRHKIAHVNGEIKVKIEISSILVQYHDNNNIKNFSMDQLFLEKYQKCLIDLKDQILKFCQRREFIESMESNTFMLIHLNDQANFECVDYIPKYDSSSGNLSTPNYNIKLLIDPIGPLVNGQNHNKINLVDILVGFKFRPLDVKYMETRKPHSSNYQTINTFIGLLTNIPETVRKKMLDKNDLMEFFNHIAKLTEEQQTDIKNWMLFNPLAWSLPQFDLNDHKDRDGNHIHYQVVTNYLDGHIGEEVLNHPILNEVTWTKKGNDLQVLKGKYESSEKWTRCMQLIYR